MNRPRLIADWVAAEFPGFDREIAEKVIGLLMDDLGVPVHELRPEARFIEDLRADELEPVAIAFSLEEVFGLYLSDEEAGRIGTVSDLMRWVETKLGGGVST